MALGERLRASRLAKRYSQDILSRISGVKQALISKIERGDQATTTFIPQLALALDVNDLWLATGKGQNDHSSVTSTPASLGSTDPLLKELFELLEGRSNDELMVISGVIHSLDTLVFEKMRRLKSAA